MQKPTADSVEMTTGKNIQLSQAQQAFQLINQISQLLGTDLDAESLTHCIQLCELGVDPHALAHVVKMIKKMASEEASGKDT